MPIICDMNFNRFMYSSLKVLDNIFKLIVEKINVTSNPPDATTVNLIKLRSFVVPCSPVNTNLSDKK